MQHDHFCGRNTRIDFYNVHQCHSINVRQSGIDERDTVGIAVLRGLAQNFKSLGRTSDHRRLKVSSL